jgi:hypothetical protein
MSDFKTLVACNVVASIRKDAQRRRTGSTKPDNGDIHSHLPL